MNLDAILISIFKVAGAFAMTSLLAWIGIEMWWEFFERTKTAKMALEYIKTHRAEFERWYLQEKWEEDEEERDERG